MAKVTSCKDLLLLMLYAKGPNGKDCEPILGRTRLMKMVFLFDKEVRREFNLDKAVAKEAIPDFTPFNYGPFSAEVFSDLEFLVELDFVDVKRMAATANPPTEEEAEEYSYWQVGGSPTSEPIEEYTQEEFALTDLGRSFVDENQAGTLSVQQWKTLADFKARCTGVPLRALLRYVYEKYPDMIIKSKIRDEILDR